MESIDMPTCEAEYLASYLFEIGPSMAAGMGEAPITHGEIESWQHNTGIILNSWEARTLRGLSSEYVSENYAAKDPDKECPWVEAPYANIKNVISSIRLRNSLRRIENK